MSSRKIVPITTKRLVSSTFGFEPPLSPSSKNKKLLKDEDQSRSPLKERFAKKKVVQDSWETFKKKTRRNSFFWLLSAITFGIWCLVITIIYSIHLENEDHITFVQVLNTTIEVDGCLQDADCPSSRPYCDLSTNECSHCTSSSQCSTPGMGVCDIYGSRSCHECVNDKDCPGSFVCDRSHSRTCAECFASKDCASNPVSAVCKSSSKTCVECTANTDCTTSPFGVCKASSNTCIQCAAHSDCSTKNATFQYCSSEQCVQCLTDAGCSTQLDNKACKTSTNTCVQCTSNKHCLSQPTNKICDLDTNTCIGPCSTTSCEARTDKKTKCCGVKCIEDCPGGFICDVLASQCIVKIEGTDRGTNVPTTGQKSTLSACSHCHYYNLRTTGTMFNRTMLDTIDYLTGIRYLFEVPPKTNRAPNMKDVNIYYQEAPNCLTTDFQKSPYKGIELGFYSTITTTTVNFTNVLPVTAECFFILTSGTFVEQFSCGATYDYKYQVYEDTSGNAPGLDHTPYYSLLGY